ncbi:MULTISPECIES: ROK family protein [Lacticaseibacillus]|uniref:Fructokinase n=2 Tax=Lacticaseibacillus TaxID=2759736 RepID=A0AAN1C669_LACCA|nr:MULTISPECIES: ROK family protein [Lacticaseibacillus]ARY90515.1 fructokinase [Lacticaseibacillus casei]KAB1970372.1 ROK family protein [Lacticaseibacillus casei]WLV81133.1 ROK family protein [Lacticaseibacillus sp. NCIMB 15473]WNX25093.1 ROK family protein [Lacticaseibacillus casei]WNX27864.1 ROK family protein [Lacticaseibacillus casei]
MLGAIEAGGTKFVCAISENGIDIIDQETFPTTTPDETIAQVIGYFKAHPADRIGLASFGPIDVNRKSDQYGYITKTPKAGWQFFDILGTLQKHFPDTKFAFTTDVNAAAYGELKAGAGKGLDDLVYWTVGTGVGAGIVQNGQLLQGYSHPEAGHIILRRHPDDTFAGNCPFHGDCLEGMTSGPALQKHWGKPAKDLPADHPAWDLEAYYLAQACVDLTLTVAPEKIVFGGGVMHQQQLFPKIRNQFNRLLNDYVTVPPLDSYIVPIDLADNAGAIGAFLLAQSA